LHEMAVAKRTTIEVRARRGEVRKRMARDAGSVVAVATMVVKHYGGRSNAS